jgi:hypothetical protein
MQLGTTSSDETKVDFEDAKEETTSEDTKVVTSEETNEDTIQTDNEDSRNSRPTVSLEISEGPTYSDADDICYYRVKATVTGNPTPKINFSTDYSNGTLGNNIAQVNLTRDNPNYMLTATATNIEGTATDSIELSWGCDGEEAIEESIPTPEEVIEPAEKDTTLSVVPDETGMIATNEDRVSTAFFYTGDWTDNDYFNGYISFNIEKLSGKEVLSSTLTMTLNDPTNACGERPYLGNLRIGALDYGEGALT